MMIAAPKRFAAECMSPLELQRPIGRTGRAEARLHADANPTQTRTTSRGAPANPVCHVRGLHRGDESCVPTAGPGPSSDRTDVENVSLGTEQSVKEFVCSDWLMRT